MADEEGRVTPRLRDADHDAPDGLATNGVFGRGGAGTEDRDTTCRAAHGAPAGAEE
jgi:hypothetical protein